MASRSKTPLYDVMKSNTPHGLSEREHKHTSLRIEEDMGDSWLTPGQVIRVPVGWLLLSAAVVLILLIGIYILGHRAGAEAKEAEFKGLITFPAGGVNAQTRDPLNTPEKPTESPLPSVSPPPETHSATPNKTTSSKTPGFTPPPVTPPASEIGPLESDPRLPGWSYFVLAETTPDGSRRLAQFCRDNGLESYVVPGNNTRRRKVIVLPGFPAPARLTSREVKSLQNAIHTLGEKWQRQEPGATNLRDAYLQKIGG